MKFFTIYLFLWLVSLSACVSTKGVNSEWVALKDAEKVICEDWNLPRKYLGVGRIIPLDQGKAGFVTQAILRNGAPSYLYSAFNHSASVNLDEDNKVSLGSKVDILGGGVDDGKIVVGVVDTKENKSFFSLHEIRAKQKEVIMDSVAFPSLIKAVGYELNAGSHWIIFKESESGEEALDDRPSKIQVIKNQGKNWESINVNASLAPDIKLAFSQNFAFAISGESGQASGKNKFMVSLKSVSLNSLIVESQKTLALSANGAVEGWSITGVDDGFLLAYIDGDSFLGESVLKIALIQYVDKDFKVGWLKEISLKNVYVSSPVWARGKSGATLAISKWVDDESTVATYMVDKNGPKVIPHAGIFESGGRIVNVFQSDKNREVFGTMRFATKYGWRFQLCNLGKY